MCNVPNFVCVFFSFLSGNYNVKTLHSEHVSEGDVEQKRPADALWSQRREKKSAGVILSLALSLGGCLILPNNLTYSDSYT